MTRTTPVPWFILKRWRRMLELYAESPGKTWMLEMVRKDMEKFR